MIFINTCYIINNNQGDEIMNNQYDVSVDSKKKGNTILIIILVLVILGLAGYIIYDKVLSDTNTEEKEQENNNTEEENQDDENEPAEEQLDINSSEARDLMTMIQEPLNEAMIFI